MAGIVRGSVGGACINNYSFVVCSFRSLLYKVDMAFLRIGISTAKVSLCIFAFCVVNDLEKNQEKVTNSFLGD